MKCPRCQHENRSGAKFCEECGTALASQACIKCGATLSSAARFCPECGQATFEAASVAAARSPTRALEAERRQLTVMFCDLVDSTALSTRLDPEDLRDIVRAYQAACAEVIGRFDGHIAQYLGDGLLVYFGYPQAHEDDAQRAVRAGLGIVEAVGRLSAGADQRLAVRVGIHTGGVVVGDVGGEGRQERLALGETPNVAARLQALAGPRSVVVSSATYRLIEGFFTVRDLGHQTLKGMSAPLRTFEIIEESAARSRLDAAAGLTPLVGRAQEVGLLLDRWEQAGEGRGQVVLLTGEPGIGKSRLTQVLKERAAEASHRWLEARCSPYYEHTPLYPMIDLLPRMFEWSQDEAHDAKLSKLAQGLEEAGAALAEALPLLAALLSLPVPDRYPLPPMSPERQKQKTLEALGGLLLALAVDKPVLFIVEDLHWVDPTTRELLTRLLDQVPTARLLVLLTARPSFTAPWPARSHLTSLTLTRFTGKQTETMVSRVLGLKLLPAEVLGQIVSKTDGVPLFVEELTKMVLESGLLAEQEDRYVLTAPLPPLAIPSTLQDSLMARLDRLAAVKEVAQLGAALGRAFPYELIRAVSHQDDTTLNQALARLVDAELLYQRGVPPQATYIFKHALVQEAAYQSVLKSIRQQSHQRIAQVLETRFPETRETRPELLAHHYTEAGLLALAIPYWQQAGERAIENSAHLEAISHLTKGLELLASLPNTRDRTRQELSLLTTLGLALIATKGQASEEVGRTYTRAREIAQQMGETPQLLLALSGLVSFHVVRAELLAARQVGAQLLDLAERQSDPALLLVAHWALGHPSLFMGDLGPARTHLEQAISLYTPTQHHSLLRLASFPGDLGVFCRCFAAHTLCHLGYPDQARTRIREALALARELAHPYSLALALGYAAMLHQFFREPHLAQESAKTAITLCTEQGFAYYLAWGTMMHGWALADQGQDAEGIAQMRQGLAAIQATDAALRRPYYLGLLAEASGTSGDLEDGLAMLTEALAVVTRTGERWSEAELHRLKGGLLLRSKAQRLKLAVSPSDSGYCALLTEQAEASFRQALDVANRQQAKAWELRAATSLGRLWQSQDKRKQALDLLAPIYGWFTEGFDTADFRDAKTLLDELSAAPR
jgi:predicted ATPase/class 3 adenylate cyclase